MMASSLSSLDERLEDSCVTVRRVPGLTPEERQLIAHGAVSYRNIRYGWDRLLQELWPSFLARSRCPVEPSDDQIRSLICSRLCSRALLRANIALLPPDRGLVTPAWLSQAPQLADVSIEWRRTAASGRLLAQTVR
jgi:hypothetical protein